MDPELKAYLDAIYDDIRASMDALNRSVLHTIDCVTAPAPASTGTTESVIRSAGLTEPPALASSIVASPVFAPASPIDGNDVVPASCSTECMTQAVPASSSWECVGQAVPASKLLPWVSVSSSSPATSETNGVVCTELAPDNDDNDMVCTKLGPDNNTGEHLCLLESSSLPSWQPIQAQVLELLVVPSASTATADDIGGVVLVESCGGVVKVPVTCLMKGLDQLMDVASEGTSAIDATGPWLFLSSAPPLHRRLTLPAFPASIGDTSVIINSSIRDVPLATEKTLLSDQVHAVQTIQSLLIFTGHKIDKSLPSSWHQEGVHSHTPWPPPYLYLSGCDSSKPIPIPWPSFVDLPDGVHLTEPRPSLQGLSGEFSMVVEVMYHFPGSLSWISPLHMCLRCELDQEKKLTSVQRTADREDHFTSLGMSLNISENLLKKRWAESTKITVSSLIRRGATVFKLWHIPWFRFLFLELTNEEPCRQALFQLGMAWEPNEECFDVNTAAQSSILDVKYLLVGTSDILLFIELWITQFICQYFQWHVAWALPICLPSKLPRRGMDGMVPHRVFNIMHRFWLQYHMVISAYPAYMSLYSLSFVGASEELFWESKKLEFNNWVSYMLGHYSDISTYGIKTEPQSLCESTSRPLMQATGIPHNNKTMESSLLATQRTDTDAIVSRKQYRVLVQRTKVSWDPGGSTWCLWFSTCDEHVPFQGGRNAIAVNTFFEQVFGSHKYYFDFIQVPASDNYYMGASFDWVPVRYIYYSYLIEFYSNFGYYRDPDEIKDHRLQWDPCRFSAESAWGQAEFQGGRDVRNLSYRYVTWACLLDYHMGLGRAPTSGAPDY